MDTVARPPLSPSGSSSDPDEASSSCARVYFGPMQSPEKKFLAQEEARQRLQVPLSPSPLRRSPRLSEVSSSRPEPTNETGESIDKVVEGGVNEMAEVDVRVSRDVTPDLDPLRQDEPSSMLANRIMRAHDNPSPPPHLLPDSVRSPLRALSASPDPADPYQDINLLHTLSQAEGSNAVGTPKRLETISTGVEQPDLISFDSWTPAIPGSPIVVDDNSSASKAEPPEPCTQTIDDLLLGSPADPSPELKVLDEANVPESPTAAAPTGDLSQTELSLSTGDSNRSVELPAPVELSTTVEGASSVALHTMPRRSSRKSTSPLKRPLLDESCTPSTPVETSREDNPHEVQEPASSDPKVTHAAGAQVEDETNEGSYSRSRSPLSSVPAVESASKDPAPAHEDADIRHRSPLATPPQRNVEARPSQSSVVRHTPVFRPPISSPQRIGTPPRLPPSPLKLSFTRDDVTRTPARRVPIQDALVKGIPSVQKPIKLFSRTALDDPSRTPAKRVPIIDLDPSPDVHDAFIRPPARARSASVEPKPTAKAHSRSRSVEPSPVAGGKREKLSSHLPPLTRTDVKLPFPLIASSTNDLYPPIPEENETPDQVPADDLASPSKPAKKASPAKSILKQPTVSSRIPRMEAKPYARPKPKTDKGQVGSAIKPSKVTPAHQSSRVGIASSNSSSNGSSNSGSDSGQTPAAVVMKKPSTLATLKRKRDAPPPAPATQPLRIRQVVPGMFGNKYATKPQHAAVQAETVTPQSSQPSPSKPTGPLRMRKVVDGMFARGPGTEKVVREGPSPTPSVEPPPSEQKISSSQPGIEGPSGSDDADAVDKGVPPADVPPEVPTSANHETQPGQTPNTQSGDVPMGIRRTSRARKPVLPPTADVFSNGTTRTPAPRKRVLRSDGDGFMGISATALKALTNSNTEKNQRLLTVTLATETIRKDGLRPESPTVKMRTIVQKQQDARDCQRSERAERRARRSDEGSVANGIFGSSDVEDESMDEFEGSGETRSKVLPKHQRGPGDEEDYETPEKPRPLKRLKFGLEGEEEPARAQKQVKWDRGLSTAIYLEDIHPNPKARPKNITVSKGCLASKAKNQHLDTLGNVMNAENTPLTELEHVNVIIKKFVYDNDIEAEPTPPPQPPKTRSRNKRAKS